MSYNINTDESINNDRESVRRWIRTGIAKQARYMFVIFDKWDNIYYQAYSSLADVFLMKTRFENNKFVEIVELYDLQGDVEEQLDAHRAMSYPTLFVPEEELYD